MAIVSTVDIEVESKKMAQLIIDALVKKEMIKLKDASWAIEVAAKELSVTWALEDI